MQGGPKSGNTDCWCHYMAPIVFAARRMHSAVYAVVRCLSVTSKRLKILPQLPCMRTENRIQAFKC